MKLLNLVVVEKPVENLRNTQHNIFFSSILRLILSFFMKNIISRDGFVLGIAGEYFKIFEKCIGCGSIYYF